MYDQSKISQNTAALGGGICILRGTANLDGAAAVQNNTASSIAGGIYIKGGSLNMLGNSTIHGNESQKVGAVYIASSAVSTQANLISGSIFDNTTYLETEEAAAAIYHNGTALCLNTESFSVEGTIFLCGDGTNENAKVVTLVGGQPNSRTYQLATDEADSFYGRDVVRPGEVTVGETTYRLTDVSDFAEDFIHSKMGVREGGYYYQEDHSHDTYLVLVRAFHIYVADGMTNGTIVPCKVLAVPGEMITFQTTADTGYHLLSYTAIPSEEDASLALQDLGNGLFRFVMPEKDVVLHALFERNQEETTKEEITTEETTTEETTTEESTPWESTEEESQVQESSSEESTQTETTGTSPTEEASTKVPSEKAPSTGKGTHLSVGGMMTILSILCIAGYLLISRSNRQR